MTVKVILNVFLPYILLFSDLASSKLQVPGVGTVNSKNEKSNDCIRCKALTDSFNHWLEKTSRGKFEGGDAAWEEAKLRSYARSEIRFVEIQEGLCSELNEHQNDCYTLAEEAEQMLEQWWFKEDPNAIDLHTWFCIENLKHCCPKYHYGESCIPCPLDKNEKICSGHGRCDGEGTRKGNGLCICNRGFTGSYCEECAKNHFPSMDTCERCHRACDGCSGAGSAACIKCKTGWKLDSEECSDIDECATPICRPDQYCINKVGSYSCLACDDSCKSCLGPGSLNCTSCAPTDYLWYGKCITESFKSELTKSAIIRMTIYLGVLVLLGVLYQTNRKVAFLLFILFSSFVYYTEKSQEFFNTFDIYLKKIVGTEGVWF